MSFGQYTLVLKCSACGHERYRGTAQYSGDCAVGTRGSSDVAERMRCSKCGKKKCTLRASAADKASRGVFGVG